MTGNIVGLLVYLAIGGGIYLLAYGEPTRVTLSLFVVAFAWPLALVWWALWWIALIIALGLMLLGIRYIWENAV